eukprot:451000_1
MDNRATDVRLYLTRHIVHPIAQMSSPQIRLGGVWKEQVIKTERLESQLHDLTKAHSDLKATHESSLEELSSLRTALTKGGDLLDKETKERRKWQKDCKTKESSRASLALQLSETEARVAELNTVRESADQARGLAENARAELSELKVDLLERLDQCRMELDTVYTDLATCQEEKEQLTGESSENEHTISVLKRANIQHRNRVDELLKKNLSLQRKINRLERRIPTKFRTENQENVNPKKSIASKSDIVRNISICAKIPDATSATPTQSALSKNNQNSPCQISVAKLQRDLRIARKLNSELEQRTLKLEDENCDLQTRFRNSSSSRNVLRRKLAKAEKRKS